MTTVKIEDSSHAPLNTKDIAVSDHRQNAFAEVALVAGRFVLESLLGEGGQSEVWRARDTGAADVKVAIKFFKTGLAYQDAQRHFQREVKSLSKLQHPAVVTIRNHGEWRGRPYIVMDFVDGICLADWLTERREAARSPKLAEVADLFDQLTAAIAAVHDRGIAHGDISPHNMLLSFDANEKPCLKVIDFGLARLMDREMTTMQEAVGTRGYAAPEQFDGTRRNAKAAMRADIYSLGVVLVELLGLEMPTAPMSDTSWLGDKLPKRLRDVIVRAVQVDPDKRYRDAYDFRLALRKAWPDLAKKTLLFQVQTRHGGPLACVLAFLLLVVGLIARQDAGFRLYVTECIPSMMQGQSNKVTSTPKPKAALAPFSFDEPPLPPDHVECDVGGAKDCTTMGMRHEYAQGVKRNYATAAMYYQRACQLRDGLGCNRMGLLLDWDLGGERNHALAVTYFDAACDLGYVRGCSNYAGSVDSHNSFELNERTCAAGEGLGCRNLAEAYWYGRGVSIDREKAQALAEKAQQLIRQRCEMGELSMCVPYAELSSGSVRSIDTSGNVTKLVTSDDEGGAALLVFACNAGEMRACGELVDRYSWGQGVPRDEALSYRLHFQLCKAGRLDKCRHTVDMTADGRGTKADIEQAAMIAAASCDAGDASSCNWLMTHAGKYPQWLVDLGALARTYAEKCNAGDAYSCSIAGNYHGKILPNQQKALAFYQAGCELGDSYTCAFVARRRAHVGGTKLDKRHLAEIEESRCYTGDWNACCDYASMLINGEGVPKDAKNAMRIWEAICDEGNACACTNVGSYSNHGRDVPRDYTKAHTYWQRGCNLDEPVACMNLGIMYRAGTGVPKDPALAQSLGEKACRLGYEYACVAIKPPNPCQ